MAKQTVFAYVQGTDLDGVAEVLETRLDRLVEERKWVLGDVWVVNQRIPPAPDAKPGASAEWDLGLNLTLPAARTRPADWVEDIVAIATAFGSLHRETGRTFVIGTHDSKTDATTDKFVVDTETPDLDKLRAAFAG